MTDSDQTSDVPALTVQLLSAYLANNTVPSEGLADLIRTTRAALTEDTAEAHVEAEPETFTPAVSVRKSLASSQHIVSLIDGRPYKTLKRHLAAHGLTPESYRSRYNLPASYPMVAPDYAANRREVARRIGLGSRRASSSDAVQDAPPETEAAPMVSDQDQPKMTASAPRGRPSSGRKKAISADGPVATDEITDTPTGDVEATATSTRKRGAAKSRQPAGGKAAGRKSKAVTDMPGADTAAGDAATTGSETSATAEPAGAPEPKRRGRGRAKKADPVADISSIAKEDADASSPAKRTRAVAKPKKDKRMARPSSAKAVGDTKSAADGDEQV